MEKKIVVFLMLLMWVSINNVYAVEPAVPNDGNISLTQETGDNETQQTELSEINLSFSAPTELSGINILLEDSEGKQVGEVVLDARGTGVANIPVNSKISAIINLNKPISTISNFSNGVPYLYFFLILAVACFIVWLVTKIKTKKDIIKTYGNAIEYVKNPDIDD